MTHYEQPDLFPHLGELPADGWEKVVRRLSPAVLFVLGSSLKQLISEKFFIPLNTKELRGMFTDAIGRTTIYKKTNQLTGAIEYKFEGAFNDSKSEDGEFGERMNIFTITITCDKDGQPKEAEWH